MESGAEARLAGRSGAMLFAGAGLLTLFNSFAARTLGAEGTHLGALRICAIISLVSAVIVWFVPWHRFPERARLVVAFWGLVLLLASGKWGAYAVTRQAATAYPVFFMLILGWIGLTQARGVSTLFAPAIVVGSMWLTATMPHSTVPLSGLLLGVAASTLIGETIAWVTARNRRHSQDLRALVRASSDLREVLSFREGAALAAEATRMILRADHVELFALEIDGTEARDDPTRPWPTQVSRAIDTGAPQVGPDGVTIALVGPSGPIAVVRVHPVARDAFTDQLAQLIASEFGGRLEQLRLLEALGDQSRRDALTLVGNRRHADALTAGLQPGDALLLIDVDDFKNVNDTLGHVGGDRLLERLGAHLKSGLRDGDSVARYGGDEFLVRLNSRDGDPNEIAQRLLDTWTHSGMDVTFSIGVALHTIGRDPACTVADADRALYRAKQHGRARVCPEFG